MIVDLLYRLDFTVVCVQVCLVGKGTFMRILILLLALFPASVFADIGDTYICDEKQKKLCFAALKVLPCSDDRPLLVGEDDSLP